MFSDKFGQVVAILGGQWGDEGKGKLVDIFSEDYEIVMRTNGGANAGHTVYVNNPTDPQKSEKFIFHLIPSGILHPGKVCVIGNGCVIHIPTLLEELKVLQEREINTLGRLVISDRAHLLFDYHMMIDALQENLKGKKKVGTTGRGIGPCYADKTSRIGIRACELVDFPQFASHFRENVRILKNMYGNFDYSVELEIERYREYSKLIQPMIKDTGLYLAQAFREQKKILLEGANALHLDIDHGTYPYVTSSNTGIGGILQGSGIPPQKINTTIGILKAYVSRVGSGPFPTELDNPIGEKIREIGYEYGSTTKRPRRCGWFDVPLARYAVRINGFQSINLTKLDVLTGFDTLQIGVRYFYKGQELDSVPADHLEDVEVEYIQVEGWKEDISKADSFQSLPENCKRYIQKIENLIECPIELIGVGQERDKLISRF